MMPEMLSREVDKKLAEIAQQMMEQHNDRDHHLSRGHGGLMVSADRKLYRLRIKWDKTLLSHGIVCGREYCKKTSPFVQWKFFCGKGQLFSVNTVKARCPCCGSVYDLAEHVMSARIAWVVDHAYAPSGDFLPNITNDINELYSKTVSWRQGSFEEQL